MDAQLDNTIREILPEIRTLRHELHRIPELRFEEHLTSARLAQFLTDNGIPFTTGHAGGTGIVATLPGASGKTILLRADIDALELPEKTGLPYASAHTDKMHACGHDGHMACLCGVAKALARMGDRLPCTVKFVFQPAEELGGGGRLLVEEGVMRGVDAAFALHIWPSVPLGRVAAVTGPCMASADWFRIDVQGKGCHGADPARGVDPIVVAAHITTALQSIVSREIEPWDAAVVTVGRIEAGFATNIIPETARIEGTYRALSAETRHTLSTSIGRIAEHVAHAFRATTSMRLEEDGYPPLLNDPAMVAFARHTVMDALGEGAWVDAAHPSMAAEDFAFYLQQAPGAFLWLGAGPDSPPLHNACFDFHDDALPVGMRTLANLVWRFPERMPC